MKKERAMTINIRELLKDSACSRTFKKNNNISSANCNGDSIYVYRRSKLVLSIYKIFYLQDTLNSHS
jgi:hypothetical protein